MKTVAQNRRARFDYAIDETVEAGIVLTGPEVKSCRAGHVNLAGSYVSFSGKPVLRNANIALYRFASGLADYDPGRPRTLLLNESERCRLESASAEKGVSVVPLEVRAGRYVKVLLGVGRGRKRIDKRQRIREREVRRNLREGRDV